MRVGTIDGPFDITPPEGATATQVIGLLLTKMKVMGNGGTTHGYLSEVEDDHGNIHWIREVAPDEVVDQSKTYFFSRYE